MHLVACASAESSIRAGTSVVVRGVLVAVGGTREYAVVRGQYLNACLDVGGSAL